MTANPWWHHGGAAAAAAALLLGEELGPEVLARVRARLSSTRPEVLEEAFWLMQDMDVLAPAELKAVGEWVDQRKKEQGR